MISRVVTLLSTLLCLTLAALSVRSYFINDRLAFIRDHPDGQWVIRHTPFVGTPPPVAHAIEHVFVSTGRGQLRVGRIGWVILAHSIIPEDPSDDPRSQTPYGVSQTPGLHFDHGIQSSFISVPTFPSFFNRLGFRNDAHFWSLSETGWRAPTWLIYADEIAFPLWLPILLTLFLPARFACHLFRRRRRFNAGLCPTCAYDLRTQIALSERSESNGPLRCPECGTPIDQNMPLHKAPKIAPP